MSKIAVVIAFSFAALVSAPVYASPPDEILDEITIRVIDNEHMSINVNDIALPNIVGEDRPGPSENANERASQGAENAAEKASEKAEKAADNAARAAENAAEAREKAAEAAEHGKGKGRNKN
ncbi:MAG: hypothetical protein OEU50_14910 [Gammaproteobacteria bacterium]|nr:hypothetical protein [Gammaproteobacteria bacterium]